MGLGSKGGAGISQTEMARSGVVAKETVGSRCQRAKCRLDVSAEREKGHVYLATHRVRRHSKTAGRRKLRISGQGDFLWPSRRCLKGKQTQGLGPVSPHSGPKLGNQQLM